MNAIYPFPCRISLATLILGMEALMTLPAIGQPRTQPTATSPATPDTRQRDEDYQQMFKQLRLPTPATLPAIADDPQRPAGYQPTPNRGWIDAVGRHVARTPWGSWTNYDEARANPHPLTDPLVLKNGQRVTDAAVWWNQRRPEILEGFQSEIYGRIPEHMPAIRWEVRDEPDAFDRKALKKIVIGHIDNSAYPAATPSIHLTMYLPQYADGPVPLMVVVSPGSNRTTTTTPSQMPADMQQVLSFGWGYAVFDPTMLQADNGGGLTSGIIGLMNKGQSRKPDNWGALAAWSWGLSRAIDYLQTDPAIDSKRLGVEGHSRWGKTALLAAALDARWSVCYSSCSGEGGAKPSRRNFGETLDNVATVGEYHWMAGNFIKYAGSWNDLPVDAAELMALVAPRGLFVTGGTDDLWADPHGEFLAAVAAGPVYRLLGKQDLGTDHMPEPDVELISGSIAFRFHKGGHTDSLDWPTFLKFAQREFAGP